MPDEPRGKVSNEENSPTLSATSCCCSRDKDTLHTVISQNDHGTFEYFLVDNLILNYPNCFGVTPLLKAIRCRCSPARIKFLCELGCDVNIADKIGRTLLHVAILNRDMDIAHKLIEHDADLDVQDLAAKETPLFYAIKSNNIEAVCMLLCYGADVTVQNTNNYTPLTFAIHSNKRDIVLILLDYCDDFNYRDRCGYTPLHLAMKKYDYNLTIRLIDAGADVNVTKDYCVLEYAIVHGRADVFKKIWSRINADVMLESYFPLLLTYITSWRYCANEWVECLYLMLDSSVSLDLMDPCRAYSNNFITELLHRLHRRHVASEDRQNIINICLTLGAEVTVDNLNTALEWFGYKEEFKALVYATEHYRNTYPIRHPLLRLIIGLSDFDLLDMIHWYRSYIKENRFWDEDLVYNGLVSCLGFFSLMPCWKQELIQDCYLNSSILKLVEKIKAAREFPSLLELSRNRVHSLVRKMRKAQKPYQFHDALKRLPLPGAIIDLLLFKRPIYRLPD